MGILGNSSNGKVNMAEQTVLAGAELTFRSDILAEMESFFPTRITSEQSVVQYPQGVYNNLDEQSKSNVDDQSNSTYENAHTTTLYSTQIMLRILLNKAHAQIYGVSSKIALLSSSLSATCLLTLH